MARVRHHLFLLSDFAGRYVEAEFADCPCRPRYRPGIAGTRSVCVTRERLGCLRRPAVHVWDPARARCPRCSQVYPTLRYAINNGKAEAD